MLDFWENHLKFYFTNEEQVLLPLMKRTQPSTHRFLTDHAYIQNLVSRITDKDIDINKGAADLTHRIDDHIRFEERELFPMLEQQLTAHQLSEIGAILNHEVACPYYKPEFWKN